jgi:hypothetical protein
LIRDHNMITIIIGDIDQEIAIFAKKLNNNAVMLTENSDIKLEPGVYYISLGDFDTYYVFLEFLKQADKLIYSPPIKWSDFDNTGTSSLKKQTERALEFLSRYKKVLNYQPGVNVENYVVNLFPPLVYQFDYDFNFNSFKDKIDEHMKKITRHSEINENDALSSVHVEDDQPHTWVEFFEFKNWLHKIVLQLLEVNNFSQTNYVINNSCFVKHPPGASTKEHTHNPMLFTVVCYLNCPENSGYPVFVDPLEYHKAAYPIEGLYQRKKMHKALPVRTNDVVITQGFVKHYTQPNKSNEDRYVLVMDIKLDGN